MDLILVQEIFNAKAQRRKDAKEERKLPANKREWARIKSVFYLKKF